ncbi:Conserved_hypothetical protein [Hexamita inflata]|uniref:N-acetyltransferase domain-containing protein n=1 Tax=Hexamita inflata TaxID=28002 RepID=A0AA86QQ30_9EUKA|nr:Conserved hypothetical protein [Hexamita inflata]
MSNQKLHITSEHIFSKVFNSVNTNSDMHLDNINGLAFMHRSTHLTVDDTFTGLSCFIPSYMINLIKDQDTKKYIEGQVQSIKLPIIEDVYNNYEDFIFMPYISDSQHISRLVYMAAVQAIYKQLPLIIPSKFNVQSLLTPSKSINDFIIYFPSALPFFLNQPASAVGPIQSKSELLHTIYIDRELEMKQAAILTADTFSIDPMYCVFQNNAQKRQQMNADQAYHIVKTTFDRGTNFLFAPFNPKCVSIQQAHTFIFATPPGCTDRFVGEDEGFEKIFIEHLGDSEDGYLQAEKFEEMHQQCCGLFENHSYISFIATTKQNQGLGGAAMLLMEDLADQVEAHMYIECSNADNVLFYEKHGFKTKGIFHLIINDRMTKIFGMNRKGKSQIGEQYTEIKQWTTAE